MRYTSSGRKRKTNAYKKKARPAFVPRETTMLVEKLDEIPSSKTTSYKPMKDSSYKVEESKNWTVAPAYNKGAYQVIPRGDVEWIGK
jgi:hypothetical protein|tara:strand:- start:286 stop:546 length:261 start_codon:yes stop_codon:yes gene_type:complete